MGKYGPLQNDKTGHTKIHNISTVTVSWGATSATLTWALLILACLAKGFYGGSGGGGGSHMSDRGARCTF